MKVCLLSLQDGSTPLHYAAAFGQSSVIETLVNAGCPVDATDDAQNTPLHLAAGTSFFWQPMQYKSVVPQTRLPPAHGATSQGMENNGA